MELKNCWEVMKCSRQPGGNNVDEKGVCPVAMPSEYDGVNNGIFSGRFCWAVADNFCAEEPQGSFAKQLMSCLGCEFLKQVHEEEGRSFLLSPQKAGHRVII